MWPLRLLALTAMFATCAGAAHAGPCTVQIDATQARFDAKLALAARGGPTARESVAATDHRQPTPELHCRGRSKARRPVAADGGSDRVRDGARPQG